MFPQKVNYSQNNRIKKSILRLFVLTVLLLSLYLAGSYLLKNLIASKEEEAQIVETTKEIVPEVSHNEVVEKVEAKEVPVAKLEKSSEQVLAEIKAITDKTSGVYGVSVYEIDTGKSFGVNEEMSFPAASTVKVPLLIALYKEISAGNVSLSTVMTYGEKDFEGGTGSIQSSGFGSKWTVSQLTTKMMKESDNVAKNMLFRLLGFNKVQKYINSLGIKNTDMSLTNVTTPKDQTTLLEMIYSNKIVDAKLSAEMVELMVKTSFEKRLPKYIPEAKVAHKIGTGGGAISDVGIVYPPNGKNYIISVYSKGVSSTSAAEDIIAQISKKVYDYEVK